MRLGIPLAILAVVAVIVLSLVTGGSHGKKSNASASTTAPGSTTSTTATSTPPTAAPVRGGTSIKGTTPCPNFDGTSAHVLSFAKPPPNCLQAGKTYTATFETNMGTVVVQLDTARTPETANNFVVLSLYHYFDGTALFRTDPSIGIIQGGSPHTQSNTDPGPGYTIQDEGSGYTYAAGDLVMARTSAPNSAGAQFFFCVTSACSALDSQGNYVVFGHVTSGLSVLQNILALNVNEPGGLGGAPSKLVVVRAVEITVS
jgi:cyclophilin family peptidyl-prolyl cis-trans isomerase